MDSKFGAVHYDIHSVVFIDLSKTPGVGAIEIRKRITCDSHSLICFFSPPRYKYKHDDGDEY